MSHDEISQKRALFERILDLYHNMDGPRKWTKASELAYNPSRDLGAIELKFCLQSRHAVYSIYQRDDEDTVYMNYTGCLGQPDIAVARLHVFDDGGSRIKMLRRDGYSFNPQWINIPVHNQSIFCMHCSQLSFKSAALDSFNGQCSPRPVDWLIGHDEMEDAVLARLMDVLLCLNRHCQRYNYLLFNTGGYNNSLASVDVKDSGIGLDQVDQPRRDFIEALDSNFVPAVKRIIADYLFPKRGEFIGWSNDKRTKLRMNSAKFTPDGFRVMTYGRKGSDELLYKCAVDFVNSEFKCSVLKPANG